LRINALRAPCTSLRPQYLHSEKAETAEQAKWRYHCEPMNLYFSFFLRVLSASAVDLI